ncbi:MAG: hypothetical protein LBQ22_07380, partial [Bacteroidales bacterium]|nr:hypothetical protein [Bacteroidales bacterium]
MEKIRLLKVILFAVIMAFASIDVFAQEPVTIFYESMGTTASSTAPASYTGYDNYGVENIAFSGNADLRTNTASSGYTGASGGSNVFITNVVDRYFLIEGINTLGYEDITLSFGHYKSGTASSNELKIEISDNGIQYTELTYTRPTGSGTATWVLLTFTEDIPATENLRIRFTQTVSTSNYQFRIDDIKLTGTLNTTNPDISITSPENNSVVNSDEVEVNFTLRNFTIDGDTPDGKVAYKLGTDGTVLYTTASPVTISGLALGENTIYFELVDNSESPLLEPVTAELTVIYEIPVPEITITSPEEGSVIYSQDLEVEFIVEDFIIGESEGKVKYTVDEGTPLYTTGSGISLNGLSYGEHTVVLELVNNDESSLDPAVSTSVTFTCEEMTAKIYELVTSMDALSDGGKYLFVGEKDASYYALGWQKTSNRHAVPVTISDNTITAAPAIEVTETQDNVNPYEITLEETTNGFAFYDALNEKYLVPRTGSNNGMLLSATQEDWTVSVGTGSIVSAVANNSTTYPRGTMQFNQSPGIDPLFSCYASASQTGFYLYKAQETNDPGILITSPENNSVVNSDEVEVSFSVRNFTIGGDTPDGKVAYKLGSDGIISYTTTSPVTISGLALGENTIYFELVDNSESSLPEPVTAELTVIYEVPVAELTITSPA